MDSSVLYECPLCRELATSSEWEICTLRMCRNRGERRRVYPFLSNIELHKKKRTGYKCPNCNTLVSRVSICRTCLDDSEVVR
jgi:hypothetical protein